MPGTPRAKSASFVSANSLSCRAGIVYSARALRSCGERGASSSATSSPATRTVGGRPTLRSRSEPPLVIMARIAAWKKGGEGRADRPRDLRLEFVHDLHRLDDAQRLAHADPATRLHIGLGARLRGLVE